MKRIYILLIGQVVLLFSLILFHQSCQHEPGDLSGLDTICFENQILPIFQNSCGITGCHNGGYGLEVYVFNDYNSIVKSVVPFNPAASIVYNVLIKNGEERMPPSNPLPLEARTLIRIWIEQGAGNTHCTDTIPDGGNNVTDTTKIAGVCFERDIQPLLLSSCGISGCHDAVTASKGIMFTDYQSIVGNSGILIPAQPAHSKIIEVLNLPAGNLLAMPPAPYKRFSQAQVDSISRWIELGALNVSCISGCDTIGLITYSGYIAPIIQDNCISCHSGLIPGGGISLETEDNVVAAVSSGKLIRAVNRSGPSPMPPGYSLSDCLIRIIEIWAGGIPVDTSGPGPDTTITLSVCFTRDILPVFVSSCGIAGCHDAGTAAGEKILTNFHSIATNRDLLVPYQPGESNIIEVINLPRNNPEAMPPSPYQPLSQAQKDSIYKWILKGALDEECVYLCDTINPISYSGDIVPLIKNNCLGCHSGTSASGGIKLENYNEVLAVVNNGKLLQAVKRTGPSPMPPAYSLSGCLIRIIEKWVEDGSLNN